MTAPDLRPNGGEDPATPGKTGAEQQTEHQLHPAVAAMQPLDNDGNPILTKVLPAGEPLHKAGLLDLDDDTPLAPACDLSGDGTCEACQ